MGYTHYWHNPKGFTDDQWLDFMVGVKKIFQSTDIELADSLGDKGTKPLVSFSEISFNGVDDDHHETCLIEKRGCNFAFCKTAHKPYDKVVVKVLKMAKKINPDFVPSSDGGDKVFEDVEP